MVIIFSSIFCIHLDMESTAKGNTGPGLLGLILEVVKFGFSCLVGSIVSLFDETTIWIPHVPEFLKLSSNFLGEFSLYLMQCGRMERIFSQNCAWVFILSLGYFENKKKKSKPKAPSPPQ